LPPPKPNRPHSLLDTTSSARRPFSIKKAPFARRR
jgi:hypothetical protein